MNTDILNGSTGQMAIVSRQRILSIIIFLLLILYFYTGFDKIMRNNLFVASLHKSRLLVHFSGILKYMLPIWEFMVGILLLLPYRQKLGLFLSFITMLSFTFYVGYLLAFEPNLPCSCGGFIGILSWKQHLVFNSIFTAFSYIGFRLRGQSI